MAFISCFLYTKQNNKSPIFPEEKNQKLFSSYLMVKKISVLKNNINNICES